MNDAPQVSEKESPFKKIKVQDFKTSTCLVLSSGGVKGIYILGAIQYLFETYGLDHITCYYGTSIGAIIGGLLIIGYTPIELLVYICVQKIMACLVSTFHIANILTEKQFLDSKIFTHMLQKIIIDKIGYIPTLENLYEKFKKKLCIVTISKNDLTQPLYVSHESHPNWTLDQVLQMSSAIPFVFRCQCEDVEYIDGGLLDPFPILHAAHREKQVFGINIYRKLESSENMLWELYNMLYVPIQFIEHINKKKVERGSYIELVTQGEQTTKQNKTLLLMFISGYQQCKLKLQEHPKVVKVKTD